MKIDFADLVVCADGEHARAFGLAGRAGIVVETRKSDARVLYLDPDRSVWLPRPSLRLASRDERERTPLALAADLIRELSAHALEASASASASASSEAYLRLVIAHGSITLDLLQAIRGRLKERIRGWALRPAGLHRMESVIEIARSRE